MNPTFHGPQPAFSLGRFKEHLVVNFNDQWAAELRALLCRQTNLPPALAEVRDIIGVTAKDGSCFLHARFQRHWFLYMTEAFAEALLDIIRNEATLPKWLHAFMQKLDQRLHDPEGVVDVPDDYAEGDAFQDD